MKACEEVQYSGAVVTSIPLFRKGECAAVAGTDSEHTGGVTSARMLHSGMRKTVMHECNIVVAQ